MALSVPAELTGSSASSAHDGNCWAIITRTSGRSIATSSACSLSAFPMALGGNGSMDGASSGIGRRPLSHRPGRGRLETEEEEGVGPECADDVGRQLAPVADHRLTGANEGAVDAAPWLGPVVRAAPVDQM